MTRWPGFTASSGSSRWLVVPIPFSGGAALAGSRAHPEPWRQGRALSGLETGWWGLSKVRGGDLWGSEEQKTVNRVNWSSTCCVGTLAVMLGCSLVPNLERAQFCSQHSLLRISPLPCGQSAPWLCPTNPLWKNRAGKGCQAEAETAGPLEMCHLFLCWRPAGPAGLCWGRDVSQPPPSTHLVEPPWPCGEAPA